MHNCKLVKINAKCDSKPESPAPKTVYNVMPVVGMKYKFGKQDRLVVAVRENSYTMYCVESESLHNEAIGWFNIHIKSGNITDILFPGCLEAFEDEIHSCDSANAALKKQVSDLKNENDNLKDKVLDLKDDNADLRRRINNARNALDT